MSGPFPQALDDIHFGAQRGPLFTRNGEALEENDLEWYFQVVDDENGDESLLESWLGGPLLDTGPGVGRKPRSVPAGRLRK